jgi:hypothetical protein
MGRPVFAFDFIIAPGFLVFWEQTGFPAVPSWPLPVSSYPSRRLFRARERPFCYHLRNDPVRTLLSSTVI